jgi:hypothetical protein
VAGEVALAGKAGLEGDLGQREGVAVAQQFLGPLDAAGDDLDAKAPSDQRDRILATPALADGCVYLRSDRRLFCIGGK